MYVFSTIYRFYYKEIRHRSYHDTAQCVKLERKQMFGQSFVVDIERVVFTAYSPIY